MNFYEVVNSTQMIKKNTMSVSQYIPKSFQLYNVSNTTGHFIKSCPPLSNYL